MVYPSPSWISSGSELATPAFTERLAVGLVSWPAVRCFVLKMAARHETIGYGNQARS